LLLQVAIVWAPVASQSMAEQQPGGVMHVLLDAQYRCPVGQVPLQASIWGIQVPLQFCGALGGQACTQAVPLQLTVPPVGVLHALVHSVRPHVATSLLLTHLPSQLW
jgi:hypothetical protein